VFPGDIERSANAVASQRGINKVIIAQVLPKQKEKQSLNFKIKKKR
jgi:cation transport ATPase